jgi:hypothetical protein
MAYICDSNRFIIRENEEKVALTFRQAGSGMQDIEKQPELQRHSFLKKYVYSQHK